MSLAADVNAAGQTSSGNADSLSQRPAAHGNSVRGRELALVFVLCLLQSLAIGWVCGASQGPHRVPDTASYLNYPGMFELAQSESIRTPGYPIVVKLFELTCGIQWIGWFQFLFHGLVCFCFYVELINWRLGRLATSAATFALLVAGTVVDHGNTISTDSLAASSSVLCMVMLLRLQRRGLYRATILWVVATATVAIAIRPAYLFLIPWLAIVTFAISLRLQQRLSASLRLSMVVSLAAALPAIGWIVYRLIVIGHFGIAPFGQANLAAVLTQLVTPEERAALVDDDEQLRRLSNTIDEYTQSYPGRTFDFGNLTTTQINRQWDDMTYQVIVPAVREVADDTAAARDRMAGRLNVAVIRNYPQRYMRWLLLAVRQAAATIATDILLHPIYLLATLMFVSHLFWRSIVSVQTGAPHVKAAGRLGVDVLWICAVSYCGTKIMLVIMTSPPIGRFVDAAAILIIPATVAALLTGYYSNRKPIAA